MASQAALDGVDSSRHNGARGGFNGLTGGFGSPMAPPVALALEKRSGS